MSLTWLFLGAVIGAVRGLGTGQGTAIISMMIGGMVIMPVAGVFLGLSGADVRGSVAGAAGGLLSCWLTQLDGTAMNQPIGMSEVVIFCALVGATGFLFARFLAWRYGMIFKAIRWLIGVAPRLGKASPRAAPLLGPPPPGRLSDPVQDSRYGAPILEAVGGRVAARIHLSRIRAARTRLLRSR